MPHVAAWFVLSEDYRCAPRAVFVDLGIGAVVDAVERVGHSSCAGTGAVDYGDVIWEWNVDLWLGWDACNCCWAQDR